MPGYEAWRFHGKGSDATGPCRRRWCLSCQACRLADWIRGRGVMR